MENAFEDEGKDEETPGRKGIGKTSCEEIFFALWRYDLPL